jgi:hypothetical protein
VSEVVWQGSGTGAWLTRRGCPDDAPDKWELGVTGEYTRIDARGLYALKLAIEAQLATIPRPWPYDPAPATP